MVSIYEQEVVCKKIGKNRIPIVDQDEWFDSHLDLLVIDDEVQSIAEYADGAQFISSKVIRNMFGDTTDVRNLSTSAKTLLNIYLSPQEVFNLMYSRYEIVIRAMGIPKGRFIFSDRSEMVGILIDDVENVKNSIRVVGQYGTKLFHSVYEASDYLCWSQGAQEYNWGGRGDLIRWQIEKHAISSANLRFLDFNEYEQVYINRYTDINCSYKEPVYPGIQERMEHPGIIDSESDMKPKVKSIRPVWPFDDVRWLIKKYRRERNRRAQARSGFTGRRIQSYVPTQEEVVKRIQELQQLNKLNDMRIGLIGDYGKGTIDEYNTIEMVYWQTQEDYKAREPNWHYPLNKLEHTLSKEFWTLVMGHDYNLIVQQARKQGNRDIEQSNKNNAIEQFNRIQKEVVWIPGSKERGGNTEKEAAYRFGLGEQTEVQLRGQEEIVAELRQQEKALGVRLYIGGQEAQRKYGRWKQLVIICQTAEGQSIEEGELKEIKITLEREFNRPVVLVVMTGEQCERR